MTYTALNATIPRDEVAHCLTVRLHHATGQDAVKSLTLLAEALSIPLDWDQIAKQRRRIWAWHKARIVRQRAEKFGCREHFSARQWLKLVDYYGGCVACGVETRLTVDHIVPLSRGGNNTVRNIQVLCQPCHVAKEQAVETEGVFIDYRRTLPSWIGGQIDA